MNLHWETVSPKVKEIFENICSNPEFDNFYLVGGTALSLQIGHRTSIDLDFFSQKEFYPTLLSSLDYKYKVNLQSKNTLDLEIEGVKVFFMYFAFERHSELISLEKLRFANPVDIGLMKLLALQGRMTIKDIIDLVFIDREVIKISDLLDIFDKTYSAEKLNKLENFSNLFDRQILQQPMPLMLREIDLENGVEDLKKSIINHYKIT